MSKIFSFSLIGIVVSVIVLCLVSYITNANYGHRAETEIKAVYENNQNVLAQYTQKVMEAAQVPSMMKEDVKELMTTAMQGRYGKDGSGAVMQWIKEQNLNVDADLYRKVQQIVEGGRNEFQANQTRLIDVKRAYETNLGYVWKGLWLNLAGYPKIDLDKYAIITNDYTDQVFKTGKETGQWIGGRLGKGFVPEQDIHIIETYENDCKA